jgi:glucose/arabinose dehydrogenase
MGAIVRGIVATAVVSALTLGCIAVQPEQSATISTDEAYGPNPTLPPPKPSLLPTINIAEAKGWPEGATPKPAKGLRVNAFAKNFDHPRWLHVLPNGDVLVAETNAPPKRDGGFSFRKWIMGRFMKRAGASVESANRITLLRDTDHDGVADVRTPFLQGLNSPFGMTLSNGKLYVANTDAIVAFPYSPGDTTITAPPEKIVDLPAGPINHHWTKDVIASRDGKKLYASVGSNSNVGENGIEAEQNRAAVLEIDLANRKTRVFASGLRNPNGLSWNPDDGRLWVAVNERDEIGNNLVPDYTTSVKEGGFYGWPYSYFGQNVDIRAKPQRPDLVRRAIKPDYALGSHTASLGLTFYTGSLLGPEYRRGVFVGQHGSWNRDPRSGYKVIFVPFKNGKPQGPPKDILTGFISPEDKAWGRPVGVAMDKAGALLVADDVGNVVWRIMPANVPHSGQ